MQKELRSGFTTGTHATAIFGAVLKSYLDEEILSTIGVFLPKGDCVDIDVKHIAKNHFSTIKVDNDDLDVTKGCCIEAELFLSTPQNLKVQTPSFFKVQNTSFFIYAGDGVGVVTKKGLKISPSFPAINPVPLEMMQEIASIIKDEEKRELHIVIGVVNGQEIAKQTANEKVGVLGGISILGTRGIVKPISADAYLDSIETEIKVADANTIENIVFTLGNTSHDYALKHFEELEVVEVGNFVYEASQKLKGTHFKKMTFICGVGKMCKIAQGCKNTHNRFGSIDFDEVKLWLKQELEIDFYSEEFATLKAVLLKLSDEQSKLFISFLGYKSSERFKEWFEELNVTVREIEIITLYAKEAIQRNLKW
ncbi:MAG: cobalt-precorrin-5B (C(1))-methyltransferase CbiD [Sulfurimonas sp.]|nr:cobalt-precorrin-5B (C(1))-methyltransferase CbiD [Sulfurimonas sp.]